MTTLEKYLNDRLQQLKDRRMMIPRYVARPGKFLGKKDFTLDDLPKIENEIQETLAALNGIKQWKNEEVIFIIKK